MASWVVRGESYGVVRCQGTVTPTLTYVTDCDDYRTPVCMTEPGWDVTAASAWLYKPEETPGIPSSASHEVEARPQQREHPKLHCLI